MEKSPFYLFKRKLSSGKKMYYWYTYDKYGKRTTPESTGCTKRNDAVLFCMKRLSSDGSVKHSMPFDIFADKWFTPEHFWLKQVSQSKPLRDSTIRIRRFALTLYIVPFFQKMPVDKIDEDSIFSFRESLIKKGLSENYINAIFSTLKIMLTAAVDKNIIQKNPIPHSFRGMRQKNNREAFSLNELEYIFKQKWEHNELKYFCLLSAVTGMRFSEIRGLQNDQLFDSYIKIDRQYYVDKISETKTGCKRFATIPSRLMDILKAMPNRTFFVFPSIKSIETPLGERFVRRNLYSMYSEKMLKEKDDRILTFHSFRHFLNTYLLSNNIKKEKVDFMLGHSSGKGSMTELYTTWKPEMYTDILGLQEKLLDRLI